MKHKGGDSNRFMQRKAYKPQMRKKNDHPRPPRDDKHKFWQPQRVKMTNEEIEQLQLQVAVIATTIATLSK